MNPLSQARALVDSGDVEASRNERRSAIFTAIYDPGAFVGFKGERTLTRWQSDAVEAALDALTTLPAAKEGS
jgi:hypothetical protein